MWRVFETLEPFEDERADWNTAHIVQALAPGRKPLSDFRLPFGDTLVVAPVAINTSPAATVPVPQTSIQTVAQQEMLMHSWIDGSNLIFSAPARKAQRRREAQASKKAVS